MFATLLGPLPRPPLPADAAPAEVLDAVLAVQVAHGLDPLTDAGHPTSTDPVAAWRAASGAADGRLVKAVVAGPLSAARPAAEVRATLVALAEAGCPWIEVHEPIATSIADDAARGRFAETHAALTAGLEGVHLSLAITGGDAEALGIDALTAGSYASLAVDLIDGPDNWRLAAAWPTERGLIAGALSAHEGSDDGPELLLWVAGYAASTSGRGAVRVGLATSGSLAALTWATAEAKVAALGRATALVGATPEDRLAALDPRAIDIRTAALGTARATRTGPARPPGADLPSQP